MLFRSDEIAKHWFGLHAVERNEIFKIVFVNVKRLIESENVAFRQAYFKSFGISDRNKLIVERSVFHAFAARSQLENLFLYGKSLSRAITFAVNRFFVNDRIISANVQRKLRRQNAVAVRQNDVIRIGFLAFPVDCHGCRFGNVHRVFI